MGMQKIGRQYSGLLLFVRHTPKIDLLRIKARNRGKKSLLVILAIISPITRRSAILIALT